MNDPDQWIAAYLDDSLGETGRTALNEWLRADDSNVRRFTAAVMFEQDLRSAVHAGAEQNGAASFNAAPSRQRRWKPLTAAAAGLVIGCFGASLLWVLATPRAMATASRVFALVDGGFENQLGRVSSGFPQQLGVWSGDEAEIVSGPSTEGKQALRFVKPESDANDPKGNAISCDVFQLVDLRSLRPVISVEGDSVLELSAKFLDARPRNTKPSVTFFCQIYLFHGSSEKIHEAWPLNITDAISSGSSQITTLGDDAKGWKDIAARCLVPADADFAVIQIAARPNIRPAKLESLFADDVKLKLKTQPALPVRIVQR